MHWRFSFPLLIPILSALLAASLAWFAWRRRTAPGAAAFALVMFAAAFWSAGNALELSADNLTAKIFWLKIEYLGILLLPAAWLTFALQSTGRLSRLNRRVLFLLSVEPIAMLLLLWTNDAHHLFIRQWGVKDIGMFLVWDNVEAPFYLLNIAYSYILITAGSFLILYHLARQPVRQGVREAVIVFGVLLPQFVNVLYNLYDFPFHGFDPTPFALSVTGAAFAWGMFSLRFLEPLPAQAVEREEPPAWRLAILEGILRGIFLLWLFALASGLYNVWQTYQEVRADSPHLIRVAIGTAVVYVVSTLLMSIITFLRRLPYALRAGIFLFILYLLGAIGLALASLSGDGRVLLFAFIILTAVFFDMRASLLAGGLSLLTLIVMGWLHVHEIIAIPATRQVNATDPGAWISGTIVFTILSAAALVSVLSLLRALQTSLAHTQQALTREQRLSRMLRTVSEINQLIVRERAPQRLLQEACEHLVSGRGYDLAWIGLLQDDGQTIEAVASAGQQANLPQFASRLDPLPGQPTCAASALRARRPLRIPQDEACADCPMLERCPQRISLALPLLHKEQPLGALVVDHAASSAFFDEEETALLQELANDLAHALASLRAARQQQILAELSGGLLFARDEEMLWTEVIGAVEKVLRAERVAIYLYDREHDRLSCPRFHGLSAEYVAEVNRRFHDVPGSAILREPRPVIVQDIEADPSTAPLREWMRREGFRSYAVFPFYTSKGMSGAFTAYRSTPGPFTTSDLAAGETLVRMIGLALENMDLNAETRRKAADLGALYAAAQDMASSLLDTDALLLALASHLTEALQVTSAYISTVDLATRTLRVTSEYWSDRAAPAERRPDLGRIFALDDYPAFQQTLLGGKTVVLHADDPHCSEAERAQFAAYGVRSILFVPVMARGKILGGIELWESRGKREFTQAELLLAQAMAGHAAAVLESAQLYQQLSQAYDRTLEGWARALELRDELTEGHTRRVTELALQLARKLGIPENELVHIRRGALLHDIGKMGIPDSILHKPAPLTEQEKALMRRHPQLAYNMLSPIEFLRPALDIPYCHHEHWDGSGYPRGLKGEEIPLAARIFAVADNWDALTSDRPYRPAWSKAQAREYIRKNAGKFFDPQIVEIFLKLEE